MSKNRIVFLIGLLLLIRPLMGFPSGWISFFRVVFGLVLVGLSFSASIKRRERHGGTKRKEKSVKKEEVVPQEKNDAIAEVFSSPAMEEPIQIIENTVRENSGVVEKDETTQI